MNAEPGWYPVPGDPPGTMRRWNGSQWIGFPTAPPNQNLDGPVQVANAAARQHVPSSSQTRLKILSWFVMGSLAVVGTLLVLAGGALAAASALIEADSTFEAPSSEVGPATDSTGSSLFAIGFVGALLVGVAAGPLFVIWFTLAYRNLALWHKTKRALGWAVFAWIVPFINLVRPMTMMLELVERSPRSDRQGELSPVPVIAWWFMWQLPSFFIFFAALNALSSSLEDAAQTLGIVYGLAMLVNGVSAFVAVYLVAKVTASQDSRLAA